MVRGTEKGPQALQSLESTPSAESLGDNTSTYGKEGESFRQLDRLAPGAFSEEEPTPLLSDKLEAAEQTKTTAESIDLKADDPAQLEATMESIFSHTAEEQ